MTKDSDKVRRCIEKRRKIVQDIKESSPCMDCGKMFPYYVMDFDHRDSESKEFNVSRVSRMSIIKVLKEITKCDLVCANCHRIRTYKVSKFRNKT